MTDASATRDPDRHRSGVDDWDSHWQTFGVAAEDNPANRYRHRLILDRLAGVLPGEHLLDIGSGQGEFALLAAARHPELSVRGIEYSASGVERAREEAARLRLGVTFGQRDLLVGAEPEAGDRGWADLAVCSEVLEHVDQPATLLRHALDYVKPGCRVVITVPGGPRTAFDRHIGHRRHFDAERLRRLLTEVGLTQIHIDRAGFPFFNLYKLAVMLRGRALIAELSGAGRTGANDRSRVSLQRMAGKTFDVLFRFNLDNAPFGWQLVATGVVGAV